MILFQILIRTQISKTVDAGPDPKRCIYDMFFLLERAIPDSFFQYRYVQYMFLGHAYFLIQ
jgi:hypothetical protein